MTELKQCSCGGKLKLDMNAKPPHYAQWLCETCGKHNGFIGKPKERSKEFKTTVKKQYDGQPFCSFCEQDKDQLPPGIILEVDHQKSLVNGGEDKKENGWLLCTRCHKLKNWIVKWGYGGNNDSTTP